MNVLILHAHPEPKSFTTALLNVALDSDHLISHDYSDESF